MSVTCAIPPLPRQMALLRFIAGYMEAHGGIAPTYREMADGIGASAPSVVQRMLTRLEERGRLRRMPNRERAIELLAPIAIPRAADGAPLQVVPLKALAS